MHIEIQLPRETEADVKIDEKRGVVIIRPIFPNAQAIVPYAYARVVGAKGREKKYVLCAAGRNGRLVNQEVRDVAPEFDTTEFDAASPDAEE